MKKTTPKIAIIGFGNMGKAIFSGLMKSGNFKEDDFVFSNSKKNNGRAVKMADIIILAVKPENISDVLGDIKTYLSKEKLLISIAARVSIHEIKELLGFSYPIVRVMPNICASIGESMSCWVKSNEVNASQIKKVKSILQSIGEEIMIDNENLFSAITVISGSGPAYFLYLAELFVDFSKNVELESKFSKKLIKQTLFGVAKMLYESDKPIQTLRDEITSKGGTTEEVFRKLNKDKFGEIFLRALKAGYVKGSNSTPKK
jgi:pyrroline-5-carboxylate reductase